MIRGAAFRARGHGDAGGDARAIGRGTDARTTTRCAQGTSEASEMVEGKVRRGRTRGAGNASKFATS